MDTDEPNEQDGFDYNEYAKTHLPQYDAYVGKHLLISLTYLSSTGEIRHKVQMHGVITRINEAIIAVERSRHRRRVYNPIRHGRADSSG